MSKEAMKQALEALTTAWLDEEACVETHLAVNEAIKALEEALAKQEQGEPVAWMMHNSSGDEISITESNLRHHQPAFVQDLWKNATPLYTTPQQRKPLTIDQIWEIAKDLEDASWRQIVDAIEAAHGIKE